MRLSIAIPTVAALLAFAGTAAAEPFKNCSKPGEETAIVGKSYSGLARWDDGDTYDFTVTFKADCTLEFTYRDQEKDNDASWIQREKLVLLNFSDHFAHYSGLTDGETMGGNMYNQDGFHGTWAFQLNAEAKAAAR